MMSFESEEPSYDADDVAVQPRLPLGRLDIAMGGRDENAEDFSESAADGDARKLDLREDGSEVDRANRAQIRGGQDCTDRGHPANIDAAKYLESAHCLRFSDLW